MEIYHSGTTETTYKKGGSPLTNADLAAHSLIVKELTDITPDIPVLSEESASISYSERKEWNSFWMVDPLDGTKEFLKKTGEFTVNIALIEKGISVMGVVHSPVLTDTYVGLQGEGAWKLKRDDWTAKKKISVSDYHNHPLQVVSSKSHRSDELERFLKNIGEINSVQAGSSLKFCLVAEGKAHLYPRLGRTMEWDTAAAQAVVEAAGGAVTDLQEHPLCYNKPELGNPFFMVTGSPAFPWRRYLK